MLFSTVKHPVISANDLNHDLKVIHGWINGSWSLILTPVSKQQNSYFPVNNHGHVNEKIIKAKKGIGIIKHLSRFLHLVVLDQMYKTLVRPQLDYCDINYHIPPLNSSYTSGITLSSLMETVERTQYQTSLDVTGTWQGCSRTKLYEELGWESLSDRRWYRRILQIHKIRTNITPVYLKEILPQLRTPMYKITNQNNFHEINCKTSRYKNSFFQTLLVYGIK